jgi:AcrR family transcriptional regulator
MATSPPRHSRRSKGERTAARILDAAEALFAERGFDGTSLRAIARDAGIQEPSLYNHFESKRQLYASVLDRALTPMEVAMRDPIAASPDAGAELAGVMTDILLEHPKMAAFFQQALQGDADSIGTQLVQNWLDRLFTRAIDSLDAIGRAGSRRKRHDRSDLAIEIIAMFNLTTGYFLSQRALACMAPGDIADPANIGRQKKLLTRVLRAMRAP